MKKLSEETKQVIVLKALSRRDDETIESIAKAHNVGKSTLQTWIRLHRNGGLTHKDQTQQFTSAQRFQHLLESAQLDEAALGAYCRSHGLYSFQLERWKEEFMSKRDDISKHSYQAELKKLQAKNKALEQELRRKEKALAETSALLVLKKKADLIWGDDEDA